MLLASNLQILPFKALAIRSLLYQIATSMLREKLQGHDQEVTSIFGIYFCQRCRNIIMPSRANGNFLQFTCQTCGPQEIDFSKRKDDDCLLYTKELQTTYAKKYVFDESHVFDPTMTLVEVECPQCGYNKAICTMTPDENETKLVARMMCASVVGSVTKCGHTWELDESDVLLEGEVISSFNSFQHKGEDLI